MITAGIDIGSTTTKVVLLGDDGVMGSLVVPSGNLPARTAEDAYAGALEDASLKKSDIDLVATTGYGRRLVDWGDIVMTEIKACVWGALHAPAEERIRTVIDVGGQDTKVIALDEAGEIEDFGMNDKCAAGTGRFLEMLAAKLGLSYEDFVAEALRSDTMLQMNSTCAVFAESEVVGMLARNVAKSDIAAAAHNAIAVRIASMTRRVGSSGAYRFVGGGARNAALAKAIEDSLGRTLEVDPSPQTVIALGAAVGARRRLTRRSEKDGGI